MIHKQSGQVAYAVLSFGGFLGIGSHVHPLPWELLDYDPDRHGYVVDLSREVLEKAPMLRLAEADRPSDRAYAERLYDYYGAPRYSGLSPDRQAWSVAANDPAAGGQTQRDRRPTIFSSSARARRVGTGWASKCKIRG